MSKQSNIVIPVAVLGLALSAYWIVSISKSSRKKRQELELQLKQAQAYVNELEEKLLLLEEQDSNNKLDSCTKEVRIWMDGAFDMMHYGHMNAFRQGKALGTYLIVGVNSDETITQCKGKPVTNDEERVEMVKGCKWVDEVVQGVPYIMSDEYLAYVIKTYRIDFVVHGDDPCIVDGKDVYESAQKMGKYLTIPRTEGISTTDIVGRMLLMTKSHHNTEINSSNDNLNSSLSRLSTRSSSFDSSMKRSKFSNHKQLDLISNKSSTFNRKSNFLTTSRIIRLFSSNVKAPSKDDKVVYLSGSWDMFHAGHVHILEEARSYGTYVIVGVHSDAVVNAKQGYNYPILNLHERVLSVMGCKYVDDVLIDAPYEISTELLTSLRVSVVVKGSLDAEDKDDDDINEDEDLDPYQAPKKLDILKVVKSTYKLTVNEIVSRIQEQHERYQQKYNKKKLQEDKYYLDKYNKK